jgi:transposase
VLATGCQWRALPKDLPPKSTVHDYLIPAHESSNLARRPTGIGCWQG